MHDSGHRPGIPSPNPVEQPSGPGYPQLSITQDEIYTIIGELEVVRRKQNIQLQELFKQISEMSAEITRLREENGRLVETYNNK